MRTVKGLSWPMVLKHQVVIRLIAESVSRELRAACEDGWWMKLAQDRVQEQAFILNMLKLYLLRANERDGSRSNSSDEQCCMKLMAPLVF